VTYLRFVKTRPQRHSAHFIITENNVVIIFIRPMFSLVSFLQRYTPGRRSLPWWCLGEIRFLFLGPSSCRKYQRGFCWLHREIGLWICSQGSTSSNSLMEVFPRCQPFRNNRTPRFKPLKMIFIYRLAPIKTTLQRYFTSLLSLSYSLQWGKLSMYKKIFFFSNATRCFLKYKSVREKIQVMRVGVRYLRTDVLNSQTKYRETSSW